MIADLDTLLIALYVELTDHIIPSLGNGRRRLGRPPEVNDAELACLAVAQVLLRFDDERHWLRAAPARVGHLFPRLLGQSEYNQRLKASAALMEAALRWLAEQTPGSAEMLRLMDATPIPCGQSKITAKRSGLFSYAGYGYCPSHSRWYWGSKLMLIVTCDGTVTGFGLANPKLAGEREQAQQMLQAQPANQPRPGTAVVTDKGFAGEDFEEFCTGPELGLTLIRPARKDEKESRYFPNWLRQRVEAIIWTLKNQLGLERHGGRVPAGLWARILQRLLALNTAIWHNWAIGAPVKRSLIAYDHSAPRGALSYPRFSREELGGRFLGLMAYLDPKGEGDNSMPGKQRLCPGVRNRALRDPRNMAKAGLPEPQSPAGLNRNPPERSLKPVPCPASAISGGRCILRDAGRYPVRAFKEMSGEPKLRYHV